ncbi:AraC family transcriptional regulator [Ammoniphilus sp. YIM 78166]|uniref:helix-turn-helix transcriptional regulator n=1 Tax=Ammoniphilus sp. YIM 78166 TaxID=1644106 RepID=UPI001F0FF248|nr:AraC family transcriptional regulator [Ammoniphilus sp. YIM 78166]
MSILQFTAPPMPYHIASGFYTFRPGQKHLNRRNLGVFDLLVVSSGCLYIAEEQQQYEVPAGHALILRPDRHHYPTEACKEETGHFWVHFDTTETWGTTETFMQEQVEPVETNPFTVSTFTMLIPQFVRLQQPSAIYSKLQQINDLEHESHHNWARWKRQLIFQQVLELLNSSIDLSTIVPGSNVAEQSAAYLRKHYKEDITADQLGEVLNFHPVYIARCMQKQFGCSPFEYLTRYRLEQAKLLLLRTDLPIARIAEEVGFHQPSYFSSSFTRYEGVSPRTYRKRFSDY